MSGHGIASWQVDLAVVHRANHDGGVQLKCLSDRRCVQQDLKSSIETGGDGIDLSQDVALEHEGVRLSLSHTWRRDLAPRG